MWLIDCNSKCFRFYYGGKKKKKKSVVTFNDVKEKKNHCPTNYQKKTFFSTWHEPSVINVEIIVLLLVHHPEVKLEVWIFTFPMDYIYYKESRCFWNLWIFRWTEDFVLCRVQMFSWHNSLVLVFKVAFAISCGKLSWFERETSYLLNEAQ